jgi:hypothetical protein
MRDVEEIEAIKTEVDEPVVLMVKQIASTVATAFSSAIAYTSFPPAAAEAGKG